MSDACRPLCASARIKKFQWREGEEFTADIWVLNDLPEPVSGGRITVRLVSASKSIELLKWDFDSIPANQNMAGPTVRCIMPDPEAEQFKLILEYEGKPQYNSEYTMLFKGNPNKKREHR
ncbi:MAG: hypothetical protein HC905_19765 [Bacteroidales bacterium]|nr:hypothetical protein [Bacteroidales bacterium]